MLLRISILYSWFIRTLTYFLPNMPLFMRLRGALYSLMMKRCGRNFQVTSSAIFNSLSGLQVGNDVYVGPNTVFIGKNITIENEVIIGPNCVISGGNHTFDGNSYRFKPSVGKPVVLGEGSWIAANCTITAGTKLPARSILAAGAVLTKKFETTNSVYGGVPAKYIK